MTGNSSLTVGLVLHDAHVIVLLHRLQPDLPRQGYLDHALLVLRRHEQDVPSTCERADEGAHGLVEEEVLKGAERVDLVCEAGCCRECVHDVADARDLGRHEPMLWEGEVKGQQAGSATGKGRRKVDVPGTAFARDHGGRRSGSCQSHPLVRIESRRRG